MDNLMNFKQEIHQLLDRGMHSDAKAKIKEKLKQLILEDENSFLYLAEYAGFLIDIGSEALDEEAASLGVKLLQSNETDLKSVVSEQSFNYCLANGMDALYKIQEKDTGFPTLEMIRPNLANAKNYYYKAFIAIDLKEINHLDLQILTNLGNNLSRAGRIIDSIRLYKVVLHAHPGFPQASAGLAYSLDKWLYVSFGPNTIALYATIYSLIVDVVNSKQIPDSSKAHFENLMIKYRDLLINNKFDFARIETEFRIAVKEYDDHNSYRKFCLDNFLTLNEHSLYCKCSEASDDDLSIVHSNLSLYGDKVGKMELLLNRIKSEFALARKLYFEGINNTSSESGVLYSELMDGEVIGEDAEKLRTSFKLCFGIFDKIAHGIIFLYGLPKAKKENIYFQSFWDLKKCKERWEIIKEKQNPHLVSLYSIANDFNYESGEFSFYKEWRNKLEHTGLILVENSEEPDFFELFTNEEFITKIPFQYFKDQALHLLQICCSAIYSYAYLVRTESFKRGEGVAIPLIIQPKNKK